MEPYWWICYTGRQHRRYNREEGTEEGIRDVGDYLGGRITVRSGNPVGNDLHRKKTGDSGTVVGAAADFRGFQKGYKI